MSRKKALWTGERSEKLRSLYPFTRNRDIAKMLGVSESAVNARAFKMGLRKDPECKKAWCSVTAFKSGNVPLTKGKKLKDIYKPESIEKIKATQFKKGRAPHNTLPLGSERITPDGYLEIKTSMKGKSNAERWTAKQRLVWEQHHGPIPAGCIIVFKDGNNRNFNIDNLEMRTRREHGAKAVFHLRPEEYKTLIQLKGALTRQINKSSKQSQTDKADQNG